MIRFILGETLRSLRGHPSFYEDVISCLYQSLVFLTRDRIDRYLDLDIIAEGIETDEQRELLQELDCEMSQGYLFSQSLNPEQVTQLLLNS